MSTLTCLLTGLHADRRGVTAIEYAIIIGVMGLTIISTFSALTSKLLALFTNLAF